MALLVCGDPLDAVRAFEAERSQLSKSGAQADNKKENPVRPMTTVQLAAMPEQELAAMARQALKQATDATLALEERILSTRKLTSIVDALGSRPRH